MNSDTTTDAQERRLTRLYILALSVVAGLSIVGQFIVQYQLADQVSSSRVVNIAGRQRMLSQQLAKLALESLQSPRRSTTINELEQNLRTFRREHQGLIQGDAELGLPGRNSQQMTAQLDLITPHYMALTTNADELLRLLKHTPITELVDVSQQAAQIRKHEVFFLKLVDELVFLYDREAQERLSWLRTLEFCLLALTLVVLLAEGWLIFRPAVQRIRETVQHLEQQTSELAEAKETAENASQAKSRFLAVLSHEIRTPLTAVLGLTDLTLKTPLNEQQQHYLELVKDSGESLLGLLNEALDFAKIEAGKLVLEELPFQLRTVVPIALEPLALQAQRKGLDWHCEIDPDLPDRMIGDWFRIRQILTNLVSNAIKFTHQGSIQIRLSLGKRIDEQTFLHGEVIDTGIGIPIDKQQSIFTAFTQADLSTTREYGGSGLGLTISSQLANLMNGYVQFTSSPGEGSRFWFEVPLSCAPYQEQIAPLPIKSIYTPQLPLDIVIVEDTPANQLILSELLRTRGHRVRCATRPSELFPLLEQQPADLLLFDIQLPEMDGWQLAQTYRRWEAEQLRPRTRIVAITASGMPGDQQRSLDAGMDDFLSKPIRAQELDLVLQRHGTEIYPESYRVVSKSTISDLASNILSPPDWQLEAAITRLEGNRTLWYDLAKLFLTEGPTHLATWQQAMNARDSKQVRQLAHRLIGPVGQLGAEKLLQQLRQCERLAEAQSTVTELWTIANTTAKVYEQTLSEIQTMLNELINN